MSRLGDHLYALTYPGEHSPGSLYWRNGEIVVRAWDAEVVAARLAESLSGYLIGDAGERYYADGTVRRPEEFPADNPPEEAPEEQPATAPREPRTVTAAQAEAIRAWAQSKGHSI